MALHSRIFGVKRELACQERVSFGQVHTVRWAVYKVTCLSSCLILMFNLKFNLNSAKADIRNWKSDKLPIIEVSSCCLATGDYKLPIREQHLVLPHFLADFL